MYQKGCVFNCHFSHTSKSVKSVKSVKSLLHFVPWKSPNSAEIAKKDTMIYHIICELHSPSSGLNLVRMLLTVFIQPLLQHTLFWAVLTEGGDHSLLLSSILPGTPPIPHTYILENRMCSKLVMCKVTLQKIYLSNF